MEVVGPEAYATQSRARPGKYVIQSAEHEEMINNLTPDDDIFNHVNVLSRKLISSC